MQRMVLIVLLTLIVHPLFVREAFADVQDYCAAVARDFADLRPADRAIWQQRYDDAGADCIEQFSTPTQAVATQPKVKAKVNKPNKPELAAPSAETPIAAAAPITKTKKKTAKINTAATSVVGTTTEQTATLVKPKPGSAEWIDYCSRKYTSFDKIKGTYTSKTGVERKCLVNSKFR
jgi:hypothetical protein